MAKRLIQRQKILKLLKEAGALGVNSYGVARDLALQLPTRIYELKREGYDITAIAKPDKSVDYILNKEPESPKKIISWEFEGNVARPIYG